MTPRIIPLSLTLALTLALASPASAKQISVRRGVRSERLRRRHVRRP